MDKDRANEVARLLQDPKLCGLLKEMLESLREIKKTKGHAEFEKARAKVILEITRFSRNGG